MYHLKNSKKKPKESTQKSLGCRDSKQIKLNCNIVRDNYTKVAIKYTSKKKSKNIEPLDLKI